LINDNAKLPPFLQCAKQWVKIFGDDFVGNSFGGMKSFIYFCHSFKVGSINYVGLIFDFM